jgi:hypothetical protein
MSEHDWQLVQPLTTGKPTVVCKELANGTQISCSVEDVEFLEWNSKQPTPLDLNSTIEVVKPEPTRDLAKELDELKAQVTLNTTKITTLEAKIPK